LEAAIREVTGVHMGALTESDLAQVTRLALNAPRDTAGPIEELACLPQLRELSLTSLELNDIRPPAGLTELRVLQVISRRAKLATAHHGGISVASIDAHCAIKLFCSASTRLSVQNAQFSP
jgi:hypothetical protein